MVKKVILAVLIGMAVTAAVFAQSYTVQEVKGRVERDLGSGKWEIVKAGDTLRAETIVKTGIGASLTIKDGGQVLGIGPAKNGKIADLTGSVQVIQIQGKVSQTDTSAVNRNTGRVSTASARASNAGAGNEFEE